jgi:hypothetical protein
MKKNLLVFALILATTGLFAKKIKFAVDMDTCTVSPFGVHLMSDFQGYLGLPLGDWQPNTLTLTQEGTSTIYSTIVDLPAFAKYEFKFVNGDQSYEAEFVPYESRVEPFGFIDNRWIYLDSLKNDTTFVGAVIFSGNAPAGKSLMRFMVDMSNEPSVSAQGVHVGGTFQSSAWNTKNNILYSFGSNIYEVIAYAVNGNYEFKYYNGNTSGNAETVVGTCVNGSGNRTHNLTKDSIFPTVCYKACVSCSLAGVNELANQIEGVKLYPNPANERSVLEFENKNINYDVTVTDISGRTLRSYKSVNGESIRIDKNDLNAGIYFVTVSTANNARSSSKLIIE